MFTLEPLTVFGARLILARKISPFPLYVGWKTPGVVGKSGETVTPVTNMLPAESRAMESAKSFLVPPRYEEKTNFEALGSSSVTNASPHGVPMKPVELLQSTPSANRP